MDTAFKESAITPTLGEVKPIDIISLERRAIDEKTVTDLVEDLARDHRFLHPIAVRDEGATGYRLIAGHQRLEAWKRHFGERQPIEAVIFPSQMPDARITLLDVGENTHRNDLTAAERQAEVLRYRAALKRLEGEKLATELPVSGSDAKSATRGGRGKKAATLQMAAKLGLTKPAVQKRIKAASTAIGEKIDLDRDTPEELERKAAELKKADKRQRAEPKVEQPKRRKPAPCAVTEDATSAESQAGEIESEIEEVWRAFSALSERKQLKIVLRACQLRGWGLRMGPRWRVSAVDEEPAVALPPKAAPATYDTAVDSQPEQKEGGADVSAADLQHGGDAVSQAADQEPELVVGLPAEVAPATNITVDSLAEQRDDAADVDAEHLQDADEDVPEAADQEPNGANLDAEHLQDADEDVPEAADQEPNGANLDAEHLQDAAVDNSEAADQEPADATKCVYCGEGFSSTDPSEIKFGRFYHRQVCVKYAKPIAIAA